MKKYFRITWLALTLAVSPKAFGWSWAPVFPYTQHAHGITIRATPYTPFDGPILLGMGITHVYKGKKLLYSIPDYFDEEIRTNHDGSVLVAVRTYQPGNIIYEQKMDGTYTQIIRFDDPMVWVYRQGRLARAYTLRELADSVELVQEGEFRSWGYASDFSATYRLQKETERYGKEGLPRFGARYREIKDSLRFWAHEEKVYRHRVYVEKNVLHVYSKLATLIGIRFADSGLTVTPVDPELMRKTVPRKRIPQKTYRRVMYPDKFAFPNLANGTPLDSAMATFLGRKACDYYKDATLQVFFGGLLIDTAGTCTRVFLHVYDTGTGSVDKKDRLPELEPRLKQWLLGLKYDTKDIPEGFEAYLFQPILYFK